MASHLIENPEKALDALTREELGLNPDELGSPVGAAVSSFLTFCVGASLPLIPFLMGYGRDGLVMTAGYDPLRDEAERYAEKLRAAGVDMKLTRYDGMIHGFTRRFNLLDKAHDALAEAAEFLRTSLRRSAS